MIWPDAQLSNAAGLLRDFGAVLVLAGGLAAFLEFAVDSRSPVRARWSARWRTIACEGWWRAGAAPVGAVAAWLDRVICRAFLHADRRGELGTAAALVILVVVPVAAAVNALTGGSPFLISYYGVLFAAIAVLFVSGEIRALRWLNGIIAAVVLASLFLVIPFYLVRSFTDFSRNVQASQIGVHALFVIPFWALAVFFLSQAIDQLAFRMGERAGGNDVRLRHRILALMPVALIVMHVLFIGGQHMAGAPMEARSWALIVPVTGLTAVTGGLTLWLVALACRCGRAAAVAQAVGLSVVLGILAGIGCLRLAGVASGWAEAGAMMLGRGPEGAVNLGWPFWVAHAPALLAYWLFALLLAGGAGKALANAVDVARRPYLAAGVVAAAMGGVVWICGSVLSQP